MTIPILILAATTAALSGETQAAAWFHAAEASYQQDDPAHALEMFEASYRLVPSPMLLVDIAQCLKKLGRTREAADRYRRFLESRSGGRKLRAEVFEALDQLDPPLPSTLPMATAEARAQSRALFERGRARYQAGDLAGALLAFRLAHDAFPAPDLLVNIAQCLRRLDRPEEAVLSYQAFLDASGSPEEVRLEVWEALDETLAELDARMYRLAESAAQLERALDDGRVAPPLRPSVCLTVAQIRQALVDLDAALAGVFRARR